MTAVRAVILETRGFNDKRQEFWCRVCKYRGPVLHESWCPIYELHAAFDEIETLRAALPAAHAERPDTALYEAARHVWKTLHDTDLANNADIWRYERNLLKAAIAQSERVAFSEPAAHAERATCINCAKVFGEVECRYWFGANEVGPLCERCDVIVKTHTRFRERA
jgi:hypothetical protein